ncbi:MAG: KOW motif domain-containing protein [Pseudomonadota bacterium]|nr:KOW motif domain-containing protein [Pseudomonadota bacterium]
MSRKFPKLKIKKGATVKVIAGSDRGREGAVLEINRDKMRIKVQGVAVKTHFDKKDGMKKLEGMISYSNVVLVKQAEKKAPGTKKGPKEPKATKGKKSQAQPSTYNR